MFQLSQYFIVMNDCVVWKEVLSFLSKETVKLYFTFPPIHNMIEVCPLRRIDLSLNCIQMWFHAFSLGASNIFFFPQSNNLHFVKMQIISKVHLWDSLSIHQLEQLLSAVRCGCRLWKASTLTYELHLSFLYCSMHIYTYILYCFVVLLCLCYRQWWCWCWCCCCGDSSQYQCGWFDLNEALKGKSTVLSAPLAFFDHRACWNSLKRFKCW